MAASVSAAGFRSHSRRAVAAASADLMMLRLPKNDVTSRMKLSTVATAETPSVPKWISFCRRWTFADVRASVWSGKMIFVNRWLMK
jgi:hypothetical protein